MHTMRHNLSIVAIYGIISMLMILSACSTSTKSPPAPEMLLATPASSDASCEACDQATLAVAQTQEKRNGDNQAIATAEIVRANAQSTLNSANATLNAVQTQDKSNANFIAAQIAATNEIIRANAQATLSSAGATQSAALTQDAIRQTQMADQATTSAGDVVNQQNRDALAASTQTAVANNIATQTEAAVATSQLYADQLRQRDEQRQGPITFLWIWCLPVFIVLVAGLALWGFWRWLKIQQANQRIAGGPIERLPVPSDPSAPEDSFLPPARDVLGPDPRLTRPDEQIRGWLDEIKGQLLDHDKDKDDDSDG